jgi:hypothetical protein
MTNHYGLIPFIVLTISTATIPSVVGVASPIPTVIPSHASPINPPQYTLTIQGAIRNWPFLVISGRVSPPPLTPSNVTWTMKGLVMQYGNGGYSYVTVPEAKATIQVNDTTGTFSDELCAWPTLWNQGLTTLVGSWVGPEGVANATTSFAYSRPTDGSASNITAGACALQIEQDDLTLLNVPLNVPGDVPCCSYNFTYNNNLRVAATGTTYLVLHNGLGQTLYIANTTVWVDPAFYESQIVSVRGLPPGTYNATIFVVSSSGCTISRTTTFEIVVPT